MADSNRVYETKGSKIYKIMTEKAYVSPDGVEIVVQQVHAEYITTGDYVIQNGEAVSNGILNFSKSKNLIVQDGKVVKLESKTSFFKAIANGLQKLVLEGN